MSSLASKISLALSEAKPTLIEFYKPGCSHCMAMEPVVEELKEEIGDRANIIQVNKEAYPEIAEKYKIHAHPSWIIFKDGQEAWRDAGEKPLSELKDMVRRFI